MKQKLHVVLFSGLLFLNILTPTVASAADVYLSNGQEHPEINVIKEEPTTSDFQSMDQFVLVKDNQFVFNLPSNIKIDDELYNAIVSSINDVNDKIVRDEGLIVPGTKEVVFNTVNVVSARSLKVNYLSTQTFWWGERTTYSNSQTNHAVKALNAAAAQNALLSSVIAIVPILGQPFGIIGGITSGYLALFAARMDLANKGNGVVTDVTRALVFTIKSR